MLCKLNPDQQKRSIWFLFASGLAAYALSQALSRIPLPWLSENQVDFLSGFLLGYNIVVMMAFLFLAGKHLPEKR